MQPIRNNVLFRPFLADEKTQGGIVVPDAYRGYSDKGEVVAVGEKSKLKAGVVGIIRCAGLLRSIGGLS